MSEFKNQLNKKIKRLRIDKGVEYDLIVLNVYCENYGIIHEVILLDSSKSI